MFIDYIFFLQIFINILIILLTQHFKFSLNTLKIQIKILNSSSYRSNVCEYSKVNTEFNCYFP